MGESRYTKVTTDGKVQYQLNGENVNGAKVPVEVRNALAEVQEGVSVDETGKTETKEGANESTNTSTADKNKTPAAGDEADSDEDSEEEAADDDSLSDADSDDDDEVDTEAQKEADRAKEQKALERKNAAHLKETEEQAQRDLRQPENSPVVQDEAGMGFKRAKGKTLSIFSNQPHQTVKNIAGVMVPLTYEEYDTKTDGEIIEQLKKLKKL